MSRCTPLKGEINHRTADPAILVSRWGRTPFTHEYSYLISYDILYHSNPIQHSAEFHPSRCLISFVGCRHFSVCEECSAASKAALSSRWVSPGRKGHKRGYCLTVKALCLPERCLHLHNCCTVLIPTVLLLVDCTVEMRTAVEKPIVCCRGLLGMLQEQRICHQPACCHQPESQVVGQTDFFLRTSLEGKHIWNLNKLFLHW